LQESYETLEQRVEDRTAELRESLDQQTATSEVLRVISQSPTDVQPVLNVVAGAALRFCGASDQVRALMGDKEIADLAACNDLIQHLGGAVTALQDHEDAMELRAEHRVLQLEDLLADDGKPLRGILLGEPLGRLR
jgi:nitrate/nitrite-specific signal transduction histidine kinase